MPGKNKKVIAILDRDMVAQFCDKGNEHFAAELALQNTLRPLLEDTPDGGISKLDLSEFREKGYLQEVNRLFFHPLGLAMSVQVDDESGETLALSSIWDDRSDPEGFMFGSGELELEKVDFIYDEFEKRREAREAILGDGRNFQMPGDDVDAAIEAARDE